MSITAKRWKNKKGTTNRSCKCGSWKQHWINFSGKPWPTKCSISGCNGTADVGAHIINSDEDVHGEYIVPTCYSCNQVNGEFDLKEHVTLVSANKQTTCEK